jgi:hypothetical protein
VSQGHLTAKYTGNDPYIFSPSIQSSGHLGTGINGEAFPMIEIRMKVSSGLIAQLFFTATFPDYTQVTLSMK